MIMTNGRGTSKRSVGLARQLIILTSSIVLHAFMAESAPSISRIGAMTVDHQGSERTTPDPVSMKKLPTTPRCGVEDKIESRPGDRSKRYAFLGTRYSRKNIMYSITDYSTKLHWETVDQVIFEALAMWSAGTDLTFTRKLRWEADMDISFARWDVFGSVSQLGLVYPPVPGRRGGIIFNDDVNWNIGGPDGVDFFQVAVHEIGHALGLAHSDVITSVMWPFYRDNLAVKLDRDDIVAIEALYSRPMDSNVTSEETPKTPSTRLVDIFYRFFFFFVISIARM